MNKLFTFLFLSFFTQAVFAHKPSDSFMALKVDEEVLNLRWDIPVRDLNYLLDLSPNDNQITWGEIKAKEKAIRDLAMKSFSLKKPSCDLKKNNPLLIDHHSDSTYLVFDFEYLCKDIGQKQIINNLLLDYNFLFDEDPDHKALVSVQKVNSPEEQTFVLTARKHLLETNLNKVNYKKQFFDFLKEGMDHIWSGLDHILFLIALLLSCVLSLKSGQSASLMEIVWRVVKIVTSFTVAHSITLSLAAFDIIRLSPSFVEPVIAISVALAAFKNLFPRKENSEFLSISIAFVFGLIHGFGLSSVLQDLGLTLKALIVTLLSFNLGVELAQLSLVIAFVPIAYFLRETWSYKNVVVKLGSIIIIIIALIWFYQRVFQ